MQLKKLILCGILILASEPSTLASAKTWVDYARSLSGESERVRNNAIASLRKTKNLDEQLAEGLRRGGIERSFALDVVSALKLERLKPVLMEISKDDTTGFVYLVILQLSKDHARTADFFEEQLRARGTSVVAKMVLIDALGRFGRKLPVPAVNKLLQPDTDPDLRSAALYYVRLMNRKRLDQYLQCALMWRGDKRNTVQFETQLRFLMGEIARQNPDRIATR
ncbi:MAG: hypothetical protein JST80_04735 [Bdellovibrionales bacterium]|nr:hypothetical protein [Bdellovibrionales bacterium]